MKTKNAEQAELILRLYELRRETVMREARSFVGGSFLPRSEFERLPPKIKSSGTDAKPGKSSGRSPSRQQALCVNARQSRTNPQIKSRTKLVATAFAGSRAQKLS
jgi:hypothetical protein